MVHEQHRVALGTQFGSQRFSCCCKLVGDDQLRAFTHEAVGVGEAHAGGGAGNDGYFLVQAHGMVKNMRTPTVDEVTRL